MICANQVSPTMYPSPSFVNEYSAQKNRPCGLRCPDKERYRENQFCLTGNYPRQSDDSEGEKHGRPKRLHSLRPDFILRRWNRPSERKLLMEKAQTPPRGTYRPLHWRSRNSRAQSRWPSNEKQHAEADLRNTEMVARREALREKLIALADLGHTVDMQMAQNGSLAAEAIHLISSIKSFDDPEINSRLVRAGRINT